MNALPPIVVCLPLAAAALLIALQKTDRRWIEALASAASLTTLAATAAMLGAVWRGGATVVWLGNWHPGNVVGLGIAFDVDLASACVACLVATLVTAVVVFSRQYFEDVGAVFYVLVLAMLGSMIAFAYTADAFDLFVFYEMFSVAAYSLSAYHVERKSAYEGALQFALTNSVAGLFILIGLILLEGATGQLDLAAIGRSLAGQHASGVLAGTSLAFVSVGLFTRGALAPLHFWFDEVHASAPTPLCAILSGAMAPLALYGFLRVYWAAYALAFPPTHALSVFLLSIGALSALVGSIMCLRSTHLKRSLAFSTVAHGGVAVAAIGSFDATALAGAALYVAAYAFGTAALFCAIAIVRTHADRDVDLLYSTGVGRHLPLTATVFALGTLDLCGVWFARGGLATALAFVVVAATGGAFVRAFWRIFVTVAPRDTPPRDAPPWFLIGPAFVLAAIPVALALWPIGARIAATAAAALVDGRAYAAQIYGARVPALAAHAVGAPFLALGPLAALAVGALVVTSWRPLRSVRVVIARAPAISFLRRIHDGDTGRYVGWIVATAIAASACCTRAAR